MPFFVTNVIEEISPYLIAICAFPTVKIKMKKKTKAKPKMQSTMGIKSYNKYTVCDRVSLLKETYKKEYDAELAAKPAVYDPRKKLGIKNR